MSKGGLNVFYQQLKQQTQPIYTYETLSEGFACMLTLPAFERGDQQFEALDVRGAFLFMSLYSKNQTYSRTMTVYGALFLTLNNN